MTTRDREVYETMVKHFNRGSTKQIVCDCGKILTEKIHGKHLESKSHKFLMYYKNRAEKSENETETQQTEEKQKKDKTNKCMTTWEKVSIGLS